MKNKQVPDDIQWADEIYIIMNGSTATLFSIIFLFSNICKEHKKKEKKGCLLYKSLQTEKIRKNVALL